MLPGIGRGLTASPRAPDVEVCASTSGFGGFWDFSILHLAHNPEPRLSTIQL